MNDNKGIKTILTQIKKTKKYRYICKPTIRHLIIQGLKKTVNEKKAIKYVKTKLHQITAHYLGEPDYDNEFHKFEILTEENRNKKIKHICKDILSFHASTRERLEIIDSFYSQIFQITGKPNVILDIACGLNPLFIPWMNLPENIQYHAYEINEKRVEFINKFFCLLNVSPEAKVQDVLINPPVQASDLVFLFKMVHCFERREKGVTLPLLENLKAAYLVVSFPIYNLNKQRNIKHIYEGMFLKMIRDKPWRIKKIEFDNELVFCIKK